MRRAYQALVQTIVLCLFATLPASAQSPNPGQAQPDSTLSREQPDARWVAVTRLAPDTLLNISAKKGGGHCVVKSVSEISVVCRHGSTDREVQREDVKRIRLARRGQSASVGLAIGAGGGAGLGAGIGSVINSSDQGSLLHVSGGKSAGVGAAVGVIVGGATGALIGYASDFLAGPVIYRR